MSHNEKSNIGAGWRVLAGGFVIMFVSSGIGIYTFPVFLLPLEAHFGTSRTTLTALGSLLFLASGFVTPLVGLAVHRWGPRAVIGWGALICGPGFILLSQATQLWQLFALGVAIALGVAATAHIPNQTLVSQWFDEHRGRAMGILLMASTLGGVFWVPVAHKLITRVGWQGAYLTFGVTLLVVVGTIAVLVLRNSPSEQVVATDAAGSAAAPVTASPAGPDTTLAPILRTTTFWALAAVQFLYLVGFSIGNTHSVAMIANSPIGLAEGTAGARELGAHVISYFLFLSVPGALLGGWVADKFSKRGVMSVQFGALMLAALSLSHLVSYPYLYGFVILYGLGLGGSMVVFSLLLIETYGVERFSRVMGLMGIPFTLGMATGPVLGGKIYDVTGTYTLAYMAMLATFAACAVLVLFSGSSSEGRSAGDST